MSFIEQWLHDAVPALVGGEWRKGQQTFAVDNPATGETLQKVPSAATLRQRLEKLAANDLQARTATWSTTLLSLIEAPITAETTHVCLDIDTFVMDNSNSKKEGVSRTYQKVDGSLPL